MSSIVGLCICFMDTYFAPTTRDTPNGTPKHSTRPAKISISPTCLGHIERECPYNGLTVVCNDRPPAERGR